MSDMSDKESAVQYARVLDEYALLVQCLRQLNGCRSYQDVAGALLEMLTRFGLEGVIHMRVGETEQTVSAAGVDVASEVAMVRHVREMDRIVAFRDKAAYNFERLTILVNNMPLADAALCGRLRDHLAIAAAAADDRLAVLRTMLDNASGIAELEHILAMLDQTRREYHQRLLEARERSGQNVESLVEQLNDMSQDFDLSSAQEAAMVSAIRRAGQRIVAGVELAPVVAGALDQLVDELGEIVKRDAAQEKTGEALPTIELF
ncbi:hypothetical protein [Duganella qianjiadongensis]|uniref:Chemotaxis protein n=1 Tax=Duganella qianjiadongensis TaxID=2692176 RepID=A0ABW9VIV8_9BURK|nr:hypothetical protein [Duganella qianjiadongensis]MYM39192.1 hypothetical protein [Duganella qianjiadongensis]